MDCWSTDASTAGLSAARGQELKNVGIASSAGEMTRMTTRLMSPTR